MKVLIIGGVAGGATAAARLRRMDENAEIILFERGEYVSYANCGLPYYIGGTIAERDRLFVQTAEGFINRFNIDIRLQSEVVSISPEDKTIQIKKLQTGETYTESYDKLIISTGADPVKLPLPGIDHPQIFTLRSVPDTDAIKTYIEQHKPKRAVVMGGGFIGLEMAENLHEAGLEVDIVEMSDQVMAPLDFSMAAMVHQHLKEKKINLWLKERVIGFETAGEHLSVLLDGGKQITSDMVISSVGVRPEKQLAESAGLKIGTLGGIWVDEHMQTSDAHIYAVGDAVEVTNPVTNLPALIPLAGPANKQARIVADNILEGNKHLYKGTIGTSIAKVFDLTVAAAGVSAKVLKRLNVDYLSSYTHSSSHAGYYPGALPLSIKIVFAPETGELYGIQVVGFDGVDKRIEMMAQVIQRKGTIYDLTELEQAYAPPFSSAKDPVNIAGFVAENIIKGKMKPLHWRDIATIDPKKDFLLDVRTIHEYNLNRIDGAVNIPVDDLRSRLDEIPTDKRIILYCAIGLRGYLAYRILTQKGFTNVYNLSGGFKTYSSVMCEQSYYHESDNLDENQNEITRNAGDTKTIRVDACGLACPGPIIQLKKHYDRLNTGERLEVKSTDMAFSQDAESWCNITGARFVGRKTEAGTVAVTVEKVRETQTVPAVSMGGNKTMIVFSDDLDKALASFVIANGIAATGKKVSLFFTFWGLNVIKKREKRSVKKDLFGKMFGMMLPSNSTKLSLSKMNMGGMGSRMMRFIMKKKNIDSLEALIQQAVDSGVEMIACTMSMDVMGVKQEELLDNVQLGGVATYLERAEKSNMSLFI
ncbi:FAD-dependent oxidoreductase [Parabacteroides sp. PF5-9]|uniref:FAD-dependent oxidoreductase n=1 Tax=Parabacteroides sp. PF5-9 TaxID=1742404 RepID=UPI002476DDCA|nr:FAD-dependent oxidoreductase [Parabacteroides sp. PF5-9]MDH6357914.1 NADPH-dependent 2,4-dienoyl-CoA reductase/sulfur reductase-like enzyme/peroxiredoxin family protein/rhodanese-related sulfurtransferase/TusA-related sulfurtransferase [Parabacteroides sp. PF5-9]